VNDGRLYLIQAVHQEAIVIPENIDAIRASFGLCDGDSSIQKTNEALGIMASRF
jgi:glyceraldehyde-3-phosphate dehydrogenase (NAD(P))